MTFDFATAKNLLRRTLHDNLGVDGFYMDASLSAPEPIRARYNHKKMDLYGDLVEAGYAKTTESVEQIVLFPSDTPLLTFVRDGRVTLPSVPDVEFILRTLDPKTNASEQVWQVVRA